MNQLIADKMAAERRTKCRDAPAFRVQLVSSGTAFEAALALRARLFRDGGVDVDAYDARARHVVIERTADRAVVATFRLMALASGREIAQSYAAQFYDLSALEHYPAPMLELGRFCVAPEVTDPDVLRVAWGALARLVDTEGAQMLFGCSSFAGTDEAVYRDTFGFLRRNHLAPQAWAPGEKASDVVRFEAAGFDRAQALKAMPPLLRSYLTMGGWVSNHAVRDADLATLHVFTGLEIAAIPPGRARAIRSVDLKGSALDADASHPRYF